MTLTRYQRRGLGRSAHMFCGSGGDARGFQEAGWDIALGANHAQRNIDTFAANFEYADTLCYDMDRYDMRNLPDTQVLVASPICKESSPASGKARKNATRARRKVAAGQVSLFDDEQDEPVSDAMWERTRATAYDILRAAEVKQYDVICWENVPEFVWDWPLFDWWIGGFDILGYDHTYASVCAAHIGGPDNEAAPQWRDRVVGVFYRKGIRKPDLTPRPNAACTGCGEDVEALQVWKKPGRPVGKFGDQYYYVSPHAKCCNPIVQPYVRPVLEIVDWSNLGPKMSERRQGYVEATIARVERGISDYGLAGAEPEPFVTILRNNCTAQSIRVPLSTVTSGGTHHYLTTPHGAQVSVDQMRRTLVSPYYSTGVPKPVFQPADTMTTRDRHWLLSLAERWQDCNYRRFTPREQALTQRFPADYKLLGSLAEQTCGVGNAVPVNVGRWVGERVKAVLDGAVLDRELVAA